MWYGVALTSALESRRFVKGLMSNTSTRNNLVVAYCSTSIHDWTLGKIQVLREIASNTLSILLYARVFWKLGRLCGVS